MSPRIAGLDLDATKDVSSHPIPVSVAGTPGPAGRKSHKINWTVLRNCLKDRYAALPPIGSDTRRIWSDLPLAQAFGSNGPQSVQIEWQVFFLLAVF